ncbi:MAG: ABC transporter ATP-binding protein [Fimbriimonadaceae bacterium]|nr:ABC transporter ATP-binding protein [Fimbriimonadaceae bacterium]
MSESESARTALLRVEGLSKSYRRLLAVSELSFEVHSGELLGLLGPNGAGKTTVLRCIAGIIRPSAGRITIGGQDLAREPLAAKQQLAFVPEVPNPYELLTVGEHLEFVARVFGLADGAPQRAAELLQRLDLLEKRDELVQTLSKGMKQKLMIACGFVHDPQVILLDEPIIGIDPRGQRAIKDLLDEARRAGKAILISTHILATAEELCDSVLILNRGRKLVMGTLADLQESLKMSADATLEELFLELTEPEEPDAAAASA